MANRRFIDFPIAASVGDNDIVLIWQDGMNKQTTKGTLIQGAPTSLEGLTDVDIAGLINGQILQYNSTTGKWENVDRTDINLSELGDVSIVSPTNGQVLVYNSSTSKWENSSGGYVPYTGAVTTVNLGAQTIQAGSFVKAGGTSSQFLKANGSVDSTAYGTGSVTSVGLTMPSAFNVANSPVTTAGTLAVTGAGTVSQYIRGDGSLADFPESSGGGSSVSYYLNGSVSQGTIGGVAYRELNKVPILGAGTDFTINANGYIASFITDAGDPNLLEIPGGNWNLETYFSASSGGGSPTFYVELYKVNSGGTATLIASNSGSPELIAFGTNLTAYFSSLAVPTTTLALTDRLAIRYYVTHSGRTITMHTENNHLCQIITTFTTGLTALNGLTAQVQNFATGTTGTDFNIASATSTHTFNLPTASATNRGALSAADWSMFNAKENAITAGTTAQYFRGDKTFQTLNTSVVPEGTNLYYTEARVNANTNVAANTAARHNAVTLGTANGLSLSTQVLSLGLASAGVTGALSGTDWSTFNGKQNALTNPVTGTGTTNYLPKFTGSTTIGNSQVFDDGTNVGIGITAQSDAKLYVQGALNIPAARLLRQGSYGTVIEIGRQGISIGASIGYPTDDTFSILTGGSERARITSGGNLLVGTTTDNGAKLQVSGSGNTALNVSGNGYSIFQSSAHTYTPNSIGLSIGYNRSGANGETTLVWGAPASGFNFEIASVLSGTITPRLTITNTGNVGINISSPTTYSLSGSHIENFGGSNFAFIHNNTTTVKSFYATNESAGLSVLYTFSAHPLTFGTSNTERMRITSSGNVGIGTSSPSFQLHINRAGNTGLFVSNTTGNSGGYLYAGGLSGLELQSVDSSNSTAQKLMLQPYGGNVLIGTTTDNGQRLQVSGGSSTALRLDANSGVPALNIGSGATISVDAPGVGGGRFLLTSGGNVLIGTTTDVGAMLHVNGAVRTGAPSGGSAVDWRLGTARGGTITPNAIVRVEIGGVLVDLDARYV